MGQKATLTVDGKSYELDVIEGTEGERAIDITKLRDKSGLVTLDPGYVNTGSTKSSITFIDGEAGILRYRGYPIEELAAKSSFVETSYLLIHGELPSKPQLQAFSERLAWHTMLHEDMKFFFNGFPMTAHPMAILSSMVSSLSSFYPELLDIGDEHARWETYPRLLSKLRTIAAFSYKKTVGEPFLYPPWHLSYCAKILYMMFAIPTKDYDVDPEFERALNLLLILHADHEQNCSTSTVRLVGSAEANLFASISAGILALWGPLHGGANQEVMEMLELIRQDGMNVAKYVDQAKDKNSGFRLMGFGHRVYKNFDPRSRVIRKVCHDLLGHMPANVNTRLFDTAMTLEEIAVKDEYFIERKLYPNVDFYSGIILKALGIPESMFTVMFGLGRAVGWIAQWLEMMQDPDFRIGRPRQLYVGSRQREYVPIGQRG